MVVVAIVGGTGSVGRTFREVIEKNPKHKVVVLARKTGEGVIGTDYTNVEATAQIFRSNEVHTVLVTINVGDQSSSDAQIKLIEAANASGTVKRFVVSEWGVIHRPDSPYYGFREASYAALRKTSLEWTRVANGYFMDYWGIPKGLKSNMTPLGDFAVDIGHKKAGIPGDGNQVMSFTYTYDVAKYLSVWLESSEKWEESTFIYGDRITWNDFVKAAEEITGSKFEVAYDPMEKLEKGEITELPSHVPVYPFFPKPALQGLLSMFSRWSVLGVFDIPEDKALTKRFPEVQPTKLREVIALWNSSRL